MKKVLSIFSIITLAGILAACGSESGASNGSGSDDEVTIGYFPNIDHAAGMVAEEKELYEESLPEGTEVNYQYFPDGSAFMTAIETGEIEGGIVGPGPAMNHYTSGADINIVAAGATGGTVIMKRKDADIESAEDIKGKTFISPRVGCTHDVQFETLMKEEFGITSDRLDGEMKHVTGKPATYSSMFESGKVDVAAVPEPWAAFIEAEGTGEVMFENAEVAHNENMPASVFVTSEKLTEKDPGLIQDLVDAHKNATDYVNENTDESKQIAMDKIKEITDQKLSQEVVDSSWDRINFTYEVDEKEIQMFADSSYELQFLEEKPNLNGLVDTTFIND
ncbi:aliphatic sulfonate ABC transporter substrate-binding protein [Halobacillus sp. A5]|uniref:aliphatic sulfonate ABC transporter substrate-binding protein n=1 Tax=Halobacillus sp. A5 TaxID=2880263 RepID=UPI0020A641D6|nr:aliphatic sulfonate ABC transporter substrate-binding protein [Halobacillus sp. A5]MCP3028112.1 ABC transporter substrate-binding protein [Halobacillus sp. A5]